MTDSALAIKQQPTTAVTGAKLDPLLVQLRDSTGRIAQQAGIEVTAARFSGVGLLSGQLGATTDSLGLATFANLTLSGSGSSRLTFSSPLRTAVTSAAIEVRGSLAIQPVSPTSLAVGKPFSETLSAVGGTSSYLWEIAGGALPAGIELSSTGRLFGTPTRPESTHVVVHVASGNEHQYLPLTLNVAAWGTLRLVVSGRGSVVSRAEKKSLCTSSSDSTAMCNASLGGPDSYIAISDSAFAFAEWAGACTGRGDCSVGVPPSTELRATFLRVPSVTPDSIAIDLLRGTLLTSAERSILDRIGNADGAFNLGDLLAHIDRTRQSLSPLIAREPSTSSLRLSRPIGVGARDSVRR